MGVLEAILEEVKSTKQKLIEVEAKLATLQTAEAYMTAEEAAAYGLIDRVISGH